MLTMTRFRDRTEAGHLLADKLTQYANCPDVIVLGIPRGGITVAAEIAKSLNAPLDLCLVHKLGVPGHKDLTMGTIAADGVRVLDYEVVAWFGISGKTIDQVATKEFRELKRRERAYRGDRPEPNLRNQVIILVDDGLATGSTMRAAIAVLKSEQPQKIIVAVPVASKDASNQLKHEVDEVVCLMHPNPFYSIGLWYENFAPATDREVHELLERQFVASGQ